MNEIVNQTDYSFLKEKYEKLLWKEKYLEIINDFAFYLMQLDTIDEVVWGIAKQVIARMDFEDCVVYLLDEEKNILIQKAAHGPKNPEKLNIYNPITIKMGEGIVGAVAQNAKAEIVNDTRKDKRYILDDNPRLSEISVPIIYEEEVIGVIDSESTSPNFYTEEHLKILHTIAAISAVKIKHAQANERLNNYQRNLELEVQSKTENLQAAIQKLTKSNKDLESFAYAASHDLQEPLRTIISYLQLISRKSNSLDNETQEYFSFVVSGAKRMKDLLQGLLEYSRLSNFKEEEIVDVNMNDIIDLIKANLKLAIIEVKGELYYDNLHQIKGNKIQVLQLFQNMISNALKFKADDRFPIIKITSSNNEEFTEFRISDNGIGVAAAFYDKIFNLFSRLNPIGSFGGSGIGLALCKRIMEYHNGEIAVHSKLNEGTTFILKFPKT